MSTRDYVYPDHFVVPTTGLPVKVVDRPPTQHGNLSPEQREYYMERRRALLTELKALSKLLGLKSE